MIAVVDHVGGYLGGRVGEVLVAEGPLEGGLARSVERGNGILHLVHLFYFMLGVWAGTPGVGGSVCRCLRYWLGGRGGSSCKGTLVGKRV